MGTVSTVRDSTITSRNWDSMAAGPFFMLAPEELGIGGQAVGEPEVIARGGGEQFLEPLARHLVGEEFRIGLLADAARGEEDHTGRRIAVGRALFGFHDGEVGVGRNTEHAGEIRHGLAGLLAVELGHFGLRTAEIERGGYAFAGDFGGLSFYDGDAAGKRGVVELDFVAGLIADGSLLSMPLPRTV